MNPNKLVAETNEYNRWLDEINQKANIVTMNKHPCVLYEMLGKIEQKIIERITTKNFNCKQTPYDPIRMCLTSPWLAAQNNTEEFWRKHCGAVQIIKMDSEESELPAMDMLDPNNNKAVCVPVFLKNLN